MIEIPPHSQEKNEYADEDTVCYCFGYTKENIEKDFIDNNGCSTIVEKIILEKKAEKCDCARKNPRGR